MFVCQVCARELCGREVCGRVRGCTGEVCVERTVEVDECGREGGELLGTEGLEPRLRRPGHVRHHLVLPLLQGRQRPRHLSRCSRRRKGGVREVRGLEAVVLAGGGWEGG